MLRSRSRSSSAPSSSPTSSPPKKKNRLSLSGVTNLFVKMRGMEEKAISTDELELTSGDPKTHPNVAEGAKDQDKIPVEQTDHFVCSGGVNLPMLLRITRVALMEHIERQLGANSVVNEQCVLIHHCSHIAPFHSFHLLLYPDGSVPFLDRNLCIVEHTKFRYSRGCGVNHAVG